MDKSTLILTKRIQVVIDCDDKDMRAAYYKQLVSWQRICQQAANLIFSHLFVQDRIKDFMYLTEEVRYKLAAHYSDSRGIFNQSRMNTVYSLLSSKFKGEIPMHIISALNMNLFKNYNTEKEDYLLGIRSIRNYKQDMPFPFKAEDIKDFKPYTSRNEYHFKLFKVPLRTYLGGDRGDKRLCLENYLLNKSVLRTSSIQIKKGKLYLLSAFMHQANLSIVEKPVIAEAELSFEVPIKLTIGSKKIHIGSKEDFFHKRLAIQAALRRKQQAATHSLGGHGRSRKMKCIDHYKEKERNFVTHTLHLYSRRLIDTCKKHQVSTLLLRRVIENNDEEEDVTAELRKQLIIRNWSYYALTEKIQYKATKAGIELIVE